MTQPVRLSGLSASALAELSRARGLSLSGEEMAAVQKHFAALKREPSDVELETIAQTWSEHCKHKTLTSPINYAETGPDGRTLKSRFANLLRETIFDSTRALRSPWCLSVFKDNAGIVALDRKWALAFKVETHNHPSAIEPYGGAATGVGGVIRDVLGAGLGAQPILSTDVFCVGPLDHEGEMPEGLFIPRRTLRQVTAGVRDYGNRMGIPTASGSLAVDRGFLYNPLVFCGTLGLMPRSAAQKRVKAGDLIVVAGGRTGRDGLHGATFSSAALDDSAAVSAVQVGNAIEEKMLLDVLLQARERGLYRAVTDLGAGGLSSAVGEMGADLGADVQLERAPLKTTGMAPWEIWLSESQERMLFAVPAKSWSEFSALFASEDVEAAVIGEFKKTGRLTVTHNGKTVADLSMKFLHEGLPRTTRSAFWVCGSELSSKEPLTTTTDPKRRTPNAGQELKRRLASLDTCSRAWLIRQYDHEVQGQTVGKPLTGTNSGPADACVLWPVTATGDQKVPAVAVSCSLGYGSADPYRMAVASVDEALRNLAAVGADTRRAALLDNFCWGDTEDPRQLGALVRAALGCKDAALGYGTPFISGKDSLHNTFAAEDGRKHSIPGTLLISALAPLPDPKKRLSMEFKAPGRAVFLVEPVAETFKASRRVLDAMFEAASKRLLLSCHDVSEGGVAVASAEMAFASGIGFQGDCDDLFGEGLTRFLFEAEPKSEKSLAIAFKGCRFARIGTTLAEPVLRLGLIEEKLEDLRSAWEGTLPKLLDASPSPSPLPKGEVAGASR